MRLIDADKLEKAIRDYADEVGCNRGEYELANGILKSLSVVKNQPTAYDVEKVVVRMEQAKYSQDDATDDNDILNFNCGVDECIEILKAGGADE